jgi:hypothetical protein
MDGVNWWLAGPAAALAIGGYVPYLRATLRGETRPNRATWLIFAVAAGIAVVSSWAAGARVTLGVPLIYAVCCTVVFLIALRRGEGGWSRLDRACLAGAVVGVGLWVVTGQPLLAIIACCIIDAAGAVPTVVKAWRDPAGEDGVSWILWLAAAALNIAQVREPIAAELLYPGVLTLCALLIVIARYRRVLLPATA